MAEPVLGAAREITTSRAQRRIQGSRGYLWAVGVVAGCTGLAWGLFPLVAEANLIMVYLLGVLLVAVQLGRGPALLASALSVIAFDFCFVPPVFSFAVSDTRYLVTFASMLLATTVITDLAARQREARLLAQQREARTGLLYALSQAYARATDQDAVCTATATHLGPLVGGAVTLVLSSPTGKLTLPANHLQPGAVPDLGVAQWVYEQATPAGPGTSTLPGLDDVYARAGMLTSRPTRAKGDPEGPALLVEVADAGPGLPQGAEGRVFKKFYRGPGAQQRGVGFRVGFVPQHRRGPWRCHLGRVRRG